MRMHEARSLIYPALFRINLIQCSKGADTKALLQTIEKSSENVFRLVEDFSVCVIKHEGENIHLQIWDDNTFTRAKLAQNGTDVELFLADPTDENSYNNTLSTLRNHRTLNPARTIRLLVADKADILDTEELPETTAVMKALANEFNFDGFALISSSATGNVKDLIDDITAAAVNMRNYFKEEEELREKIIAEIRNKITALAKATGFLTNKALNEAKITGLAQLITELQAKKDTPIAKIIADVRAKHTKLDDGKVSRNTKAMLNRFVAESESISINHLDHENQAPGTSSYRHGS